MNKLVEVVFNKRDLNPLTKIMLRDLDTTNVFSIVVGYSNSGHFINYLNMVISKIGEIISDLTNSYNGFEYLISNPKHSREVITITIFALLSNTDDKVLKRFLINLMEKEIHNIIEFNKQLFEPKIEVVLEKSELICNALLKIKTSNDFKELEKSLDFILKANKMLVLEDSKKHILIPIIYNNSVIEVLIFK